MKNKTYTIKTFKENIKQNKFSEAPVVTKDYEITSNENGSTFKITEEKPDREQDIVFAKGLDITNYLKNPVVLWGHDSSELPIGKCVNIEQVEDGWIATVEFVSEDVPYIGAKAEAIRRLIKDGFLSAVSIGFIPTEWDFNEEGGLNILKSELTEFSVVSVPCLPTALVEERTLTTAEPVVQEEEKEKPSVEDIEEKRLKYKKELKRLGF